MKINLFFLLLSIFLSNNAFSADAEITFHVGMKDYSKQIIGITIDNKVNPEGYHYYITYILLDDKCQPGAPVTAELKGLMANKQSTIHIPVTGSFTYYRIIDFFAYNDMGIPLSVRDNTEGIIMSRDSTFVESCNKLRNP